MMLLDGGFCVCLLSTFACMYVYIYICVCPCMCMYVCMSVCLPPLPNLLLLLLSITLSLPHALSPFLISSSSLLSFLFFPHALSPSAVSHLFFFSPTLPLLHNFLYLCLSHILSLNATSSLTSSLSISLPL